MMLLQPIRRHRLLTSFSSLPLLTTPEKKETLWVMTDTAVAIDLSGKAKCAKEVLGEEINAVFYRYYANFYDLEELHKAGATEELAESRSLLLCDPSYRFEASERVVRHKP